MRLGRPLPAPDFARDRAVAIEIGAGCVPEGPSLLTLSGLMRVSTRHAKQVNLRTQTTNVSAVSSASSGRFNRVNQDTWYAVLATSTGGFRGWGNALDSGMGRPFRNSAEL